EQFRASYLDYDLCDVYNEDEFQYTFVDNDSRKDVIVNFALTCNGDGSQRLPPFIIIANENKSLLSAALGADPNIAISSGVRMDTVLFNMWMDRFEEL
ncbi:hypothetical protein GGF44_001856, partial [Coemansia sp. RSA 1694]